MGSDFARYYEWIDKHNINRNHVHIKEENYTAQAFITTDVNDNQITTFHPGAMNLAHEIDINEAKDIDLAIVAPDGKYGMIQHAQQLHEAGIPFIFDPGQGITMFDDNELVTFTKQATYITLNKYEMQLFCNRTGLSKNEITKVVESLIITNGRDGSHIYTEGKRIDIPCATTKKLVDPTGCGDAYRAGLIYGIMHGKDWEITGRIASLLGAINMEQYGNQNHVFTMEIFNKRFKDNFNYELVR